MLESRKTKESSIIGKECIPNGTEYRISIIFFHYGCLIFPVRGLLDDTIIQNQVTGNEVFIDPAGQFK